MGAKSNKRVLTIAIVLMALVAALTIAYRMTRPYEYPSPTWSQEGPATALRKVFIPAASLALVKETLAQLARADGMQFLQRENHPQKPWYDWHLWNRDYEISVNNNLDTEHFSIGLYLARNRSLEAKGMMALSRAVDALAALPGASVKTN